MLSACTRQWASRCRRPAFPACCLPMLAASSPRLACSFEWVTCDISSDKELEEIHDLLGAHYVEVRAMFVVAGPPQALYFAALRTPAGGALGGGEEQHVGSSQCRVCADPLSLSDLQPACAAPHCVEVGRVRN